MSAEPTVTALYASLPQIDCKGLCARSCGPVMASVGEAERCGAKYTLVNTDSHGAVALFDYDRKLRCHKLKNGRCTVYEDRPMVCRLWGIVESMPCLWGCKPDRYLTAAEGHDFLAAIASATSTGPQAGATQENTDG